MTGTRDKDNAPETPPEEKERPGMQWRIYYQSRELARELGDPCLGTVTAGTKEEAEALAAKDGNILSRMRYPGGLWAARVRDDETELAR